MRKNLGGALFVAAMIVLSLAALPWPGDAQPVRESNESIANYAGAAVLVEHDTNLISPNCRALFATTSGNFVVDMAREGTDQSFAVTAGQLLPVRIKRFKAASTATGVCLW